MTTIDFHVHLGRSRDGASLTLAEIKKAMARYRIKRSVLFAVDQADAGPAYEKANSRVLKASFSDPHFIPFARLNPRSGEKAFRELARCLKAGIRGIKLHPRSENFSPEESERIVSEIEKGRLPILLHTSHEKNCRPREWEKIFTRHRKVPFILAHGGKDAFLEAIAIARRHSHVWLETSTLSYWRTSVILKQLGASRVVFGSDLPYSHPAVEQVKLKLLLNSSEQRKVYSDNPKRILGE